MRQEQNQINTLTESNMTDFIPGEAYRLDIITADETTIVDSWQGHVKADVVSNSGAILVDVSTGKLYGTHVGNIEKADGTEVLNILTGNITGNLKGNILDSGGDLAFDSLSGHVMAPSRGNLLNTDGEIMINTSAQSISATTISGTFYGDLNGTITSESIIYGTFNGDFNGTMYGDFFGDTTGNHIGDVTGDITGNLTGAVTGSITGDLLGTRAGSDTPTRLNSWDPEREQWNWVGGIGHPVPTEAPIIVVGANLSETTLTAHITHYDGTPVVRLSTETSPSHKADFLGRVLGDVAWDNSGSYETILTANTDGTFIHPANKKVNIATSTAPADDVNIYSDNIYIETANDESLLVNTYGGTIDAKTAVANNNSVFGIAVSGYNGNGFAPAGVIGILADGTPNSSGASVPSKFSVAVSGYSNSYNPTGSDNLEFNSKGVLSAPIFKARGMPFSTRDSLTAEPGMIIFNESNNTFQGYTGSSWVDLH